MASRRNSRRRLLAVGLATLLALVAAELALRVTRPEIAWHSLEDEFLGWSSMEYRRFDPGSEPDGRRRILFLGDSNLAGSGIQRPNQRFPRLLRDRLEGTDLEILASGGWGTDQETLAYLQKGRAWQPDVVVVAFTAYNDPANVFSNGNRPDNPKPWFAVNAETGTLELHAADGELLEAVARDPERAPLFESRLIDLLRFHFGERGAQPTPEARADPRYRLFPAFSASRDEVLQCLGQLRGGRRTLDWSPQTTVSPVTAYVGESLPLNEHAWLLVERVLAFLRDEVRAAGSELHVLLLPIPFDPRDPTTIPGQGFERELETPDGPFTFRAAEPAERLSTIAERLDLVLHDPTTDFHRRVVEEDLVESVWPDPTDTHLSPRGHELLADWLEPRLAGSDQE